MILNHFKIAFRSLLRRRTYTAINLMGLSLGMTATIFAFLWVQNEFNFDRYHEKADRLYRVNADLDVGNGEVWHWALVPWPMLEVMKNEVPEVASAAALFDNPWKGLTVRKEATILKSKQYAYVNEDWFEMFDHRFVQGTGEGFHEQLHHAILTEDFAISVFGMTDVLGMGFQIDSVDFVVHGILENHPVNSSFDFEMVLPLGYYFSNTATADMGSWNNFNYLTFVELQPGTDEVALGEKLTTLMHQHDADRENATLSFQPLSEVHFDEERMHPSMLTGSRHSAYTFGIIGLIILFLASVNYVSLTTAQAGMRTRKIGVRKIIGASGSQIFRLLFSESLITSFMALILALGIVQLLLPYFNQFTEKSFSINPQNSAIWLVVGGTLLITLLMSGIYPALFLKGFAPGQFLRGEQFLRIRNTTFRKGLVITQFTLTVGLIIGALVILQQQDYIRKKDLGYDRAHIFEFTLPYSPQRPEKVQAVKQELNREPSVVATTAINSSLIDVQNSHSGSVDWDGRPAEFEPLVYKLSVDPAFNDLVELPLLDGRWFEAGREADARNVILNETAIRTLGVPEPVVGKRFSIHDYEGQVIGVVKDFHFQSLRNEIGPLVLTHHARSQSTVLVKAEGGQAPAALAAAQAAWNRQYPGQPFEYHFLDDSFDRMYKSDHQSAALFRCLAGLALFISCLGLFGLAVFSTQQRTKEIGIRKVLGATTAKLVGLLSKDFLKLVLVAMVIASPLAYYFANIWLQDFAYRIDIQWWVFALAGAVATGVAFLTVGYQSAKAAMANPVESLRSE
ncbi:MAG: ABC transporter permease [Bacteroidota bacterium]